jgi:type IV pilus biogenesis protein CpaD/CtpE
MTGKHLVLAALAVSLLGCAAEPPSTGGKLPRQTATVETICGNTIRLQKNQAEYQACVESVVESSGARLVRAPAADNQMAALSLFPADSDPNSYFTASSAIRRVREERACAQLGLGNDVAAFVRCVVTLDMNLFVAAHPGA